MKKIIIIAFLFLQSVISVSKEFQPIRIDGSYCMLDNSIILSNIIYTLDSTFIQDMYDENCKLILVVEIDSSGYLLKIEDAMTLKRSNVIFRDSLLGRIEDYAKENYIQFHMCYQYVHGLKLEHIKKEENNIIDIGIPSTMHHYLLDYMKTKGILRNDY